MYNLEDIKTRSVSQTDLVVSHTDALELLYIYQSMNVPIKGWKGFILHENGQLTFSAKHQGPAELSSIPHPSAFALANNTIMQSNTEWQTQPEVPGAELLYCGAKAGTSPAATKILSFRRSRRRVEKPRVYLEILRLKFIAIKYN